MDRPIPRALWAGLAPLVALALGTLWQPGPARAEDDPASLADMDLEALLDAELIAMGISGIHHTHEQGEMMVGFTFMYMTMDGNRDRTDDLSDREVLAQFPVTPTSMDMEMYMLHLMYAPLERLTLMAMVPYQRLSMDHRTRMGRRFTTRSDGLGDVRVKALYELARRGRHRLVLDMGLSTPTGSIDERDQTPMGNVVLPYPMQLGSGTWDLLPALTYLGQSPSWSWGARAGGTIRVGRNDEDYRLGNRAEATTWVARKLARFMSASLRLDGAWWGNVSGADDRLNPRLVPTADPDRRGGQRLDLLFGVNLFALEGPLAGNRLSLEYGFPIYQWLRGPQLETEHRVSASWEWTF